MLFLPLLIFIFGVSVQRVSSQGWDGPGHFTHEDEVNKWHHRHLINMTENICKDATYKLRQSDLVQTAYKHTIGYELGMLACGIMEKFRHMVRMYRYYSNPQSFRDHKHNSEQIINAYAILQSDYSELIAEIVLYYEVLEDHRQQQAARYLRARVYAKKHGMAVKAVLDLMNKGIDLEQLHPKRRSMQTDSPVYDELEESLLLEELQKADNKTEGLFPENSKTKGLFPEKSKTAGLFPEKFKAATKRFANVSSEEAEYKKKLRYIMWAEKWDGFNPATEGVHIDATIAKLGLNESDFLLNDLRGDV